MFSYLWLQHRTLNPVMFGTAIITNCLVHRAVTQYAGKDRDDAHSGQCLHIIICPDSDDGHTCQHTQLLLRQSYITLHSFQMIGFSVSYELWVPLCYKSVKRI